LKPGAANCFMMNLAQIGLDFSNGVGTSL